VRLQEGAGRYITIKVIGREEDNLFQMHEEESDWDVDAEAVIAREVRVETTAAGRWASLNNVANERPLLCVPADELRRLESLAEESFQHAQIENYSSAKRARPAAGIDISSAEGALPPPGPAKKQKKKPVAAAPSKSKKAVKVKTAKGKTDKAKKKKSKK
jgi:hypothetical protein